MNFEERTKWVKELLACNAVRDRKIRDDIVDELPQQMRAHIQRSEADHVDVMNILKRILEFDDGLTQFIKIIRFYEGDSRPMEAVNRLYEQTTSSVSGSEEVAISNQTLANLPAIDTSNEMPAPEKNTPLNSRSATFHYNRGNVYCEQGKYGEAIADYDRAIQLKPDYAPAYINRGNVYYSQSKYGEAIADYGRAIQFSPNYVDAYVCRGNAYYYQSKYDEAIADYGRAIQFGPNYVDAYICRGNAYYDQSKYAEAIADYEQAIQLNPNYANAYNGRGNAYMAQGEHTKALADYNRAIELTSG